MQKGFVKLWRRSRHSEVFKDPTTWYIWTWCLMTASHKPQMKTIKTRQGHKTVVLLPGQFTFGRKSASKELNLSPSKILRVIRKLEAMGNIRIATSDTVSIITITNWENYQFVGGISSESEHQNETDSQDISGSFGDDPEKVNTKEKSEHQKSEKVNTKTSEKWTPKPEKSGHQNETDSQGISDSSRDEPEKVNTKTSEKWTPKPEKSEHQKSEKVNTNKTTYMPSPEKSEHQNETDSQDISGSFGDDPEKVNTKKNRKNEAPQEYKEGRQEFADSGSSGPWDIQEFIYIVEEIVSHLNERTGKNYRSRSKKTRSLIKARMAEGYNLDDFKYVIDVKAAKWGNNPDYRDYLRPETLFGTKFESYRNEDPWSTRAFSEKTRRTIENLKMWEGEEP